MVDNIMLYIKFFAVHLKSQLQDRASFLSLSLSQALMTITGILSLLIIVDKHVDIGGFTRDEILFTYSMVLMSFALAEGLFRGFDGFSRILSDGGFDRMLVRPRNLVLQILGHTIELSRIGRILVALVTMIYYGRVIELSSILLIAVMVCSGAIVISCLYVIQGSICFYTTQALEFMNIFTDGTREFSKIPFASYGKQILFVLTFIVPLALIQYYPSLVLYGKSTSLLYTLAPLLATLFIIPTSLIWKVGRHHYKSIGS